MRSVPVVIALAVCVVHTAIWSLTQEKIHAADVNGPLASVSYSPFQRHPEEGYKPTVEQIRADLKNIVGSTRAIRTYSATGGVELVPPVAADVGLRVTLGAWVGPNKQQNQAELRCAVDLVRKNRNTVNAMVVGNETIFRAEPAVYEAEPEGDDKTCPEAKPAALF